MSDIKFKDDDYEEEPSDGISLGEEDTDEEIEQMDIVVRDKNGKLDVEKCILATDEVMQEVFQQLADLEETCAEVFRRNSKLEDKVRRLQDKLGVSSSSSSSRSSKKRRKH